MQKATAQPEAGFRVAGINREQNARERVSGVDSTGFLFIIATIIGLWGMGTLFFGLMHCGGLGELGLEWLNAVTGV